MKKPRFIISGGGTGGHIYPAVAVCEALKKDAQTKDFFFVGNPDNLEFDITQKNGYKFLPVKIKGMPRKIGIELIPWTIQLQFAIFKALYYIYKYT